MEKRRLSELPDELILKIFSSLPMFEETVATNLLSKRWQDPWKLVSDVTLVDDDQSFVTVMSFIYGSLLSNDAQILERLHLKLVRIKSASNIDFVVQVAVNRSVRKLRIDLSGKTLELSRCLSTCTTLKSLILREVGIVGFPHGLCLPSLKSLHLFSLKLRAYDSVARLLQICPVLEYLVLNQTKYPDVPFDGVRFWLPSLKSLHLLSVKFSSDQSAARLLQSCPVLEYLVVNKTKFDRVMLKVAPPRFYQSSLKSLHLLSVEFSSDESVARLLQSCPVLEDLVINRTKDDNVKFFNINVPTLRSLSINNSRGKRVYVEEIHGFVINAPALEKLNFKDTCSNFVMFEYMPEVTKANIEIICDQSEKFIGSLTSIQHLSLCSLTSKTPYPRGTFFFFLEHLELCTCSAGWANLLACILNDVPRLQSLKLKSKHDSDHYNDDPMNLWIEPTVVPECLSKHLEILEWRQYEGTEKERKVAAYILENAACLNMGTFSISSTCRHKYTELKDMSRVSETCQLVFE